MTTAQPGGKFIVFEGTWGAGKSTQAQRLVQLLLDNDIPALFHQDPLFHPTQPEILLSKTHDNSPYARALLTAAARAQAMDTVIKPALAEGQTVVAEGYIYASAAYESGVSDIPVAAIRDINFHATRGRLPDLVLLLDLPPRTGMLRAEKNKTKALTPEYQQFMQDLILPGEIKASEAYQQMARLDRRRWEIVNAAQSEEFIAAQVAGYVLDVLNGARHQG